MKISKNEYCIMPPSDKYSNVRYNGLERHELYFGTKHRDKSIEHGLIVYLTPEQHRGTNGVHGKNGSNFNEWLKQEGQKAFNNNNEFIKIFGRNYL